MIIGLIIRHGIGKKVGKHRSLRSPNALRTSDRIGQRIKKTEPIGSVFLWRSTVDCFGDKSPRLHFIQTASLRSASADANERTSYVRPYRTTHKKNRTNRLCFFMAIPVRFERTTHSLEGCCSIQLSYGTFKQWCYITPIKISCQQKNNRFLFLHIPQ